MKCPNTIFHINQTAAGLLNEDKQTDGRTDRPSSTPAPQGGGGGGKGRRACYEQVEAKHNTVCQ